MHYEPNLNTIIFITIFVGIYLAILVRNAARNVIDIYDLMLLSMVAVVPFVLVFFPVAFSELASLLGVEFQFVVLFGLLILIIFILLYRLIVLTNVLSKSNIKIIQEMGILRLKLHNADKADTGSAKAASDDDKSQG